MFYSSLWTMSTMITLGCVLFPATLLRSLLSRDRRFSLPKHLQFPQCDRKFSLNIPQLVDPFLRFPQIYFQFHQLFIFAANKGQDGLLPFQFLLNLLVYFAVFVSERIQFCFLLGIHLVVVILELNNDILDFVPFGQQFLDLLLVLGPEGLHVHGDEYFFLLVAQFHEVRCLLRQCAYLKLLLVQGFLKLEDLRLQPESVQVVGAGFGMGLLVGGGRGFGVVGVGVGGRQLGDVGGPYAVLLLHVRRMVPPHIGLLLALLRVLVPQRTQPAPLQVVQWLGDYSSHSGFAIPVQQLGQFYNETSMIYNSSVGQSASGILFLGECIDLLYVLFVDFPISNYWRVRLSIVL